MRLLQRLVGRRRFAASRRLNATVEATTGSSVGVRLNCVCVCDGEPVLSPPPVPPPESRGYCVLPHDGQQRSRLCIAFAGDLSWIGPALCCMVEQCLQRASC